MKNNNEKLNGWGLLIAVAFIVAIFVILALSVGSNQKYAHAEANMPYPPPDEDCHWAFIKIWDESTGYQGIFWRPPIDQYVCYIWVGAEGGKEFHFYSDSCTNSGVCAGWFRPGWPVTVYLLEGSRVKIQQINIYTTKAINRWIPEVIKE